jgi:D-alanyl-D-alanine carboxypeptidase (penicillin-binding protein 5/6)
MNERYSKRWQWPMFIIALILIGLYMRPLPKIVPTRQLPPMPKAQTAGLPWPSGGQAALGAEGYGLLGRHGDSKPVPIGSTAKVITALAVLRQKPLIPGSQGPEITISQADVDSFNTYYSQGGSVTQVSAGEQITEYQALESMLIPSSNNMADTLAAWAFGSISSYLAYANQMAASLGLTHTHVGDSNGFSDSTTSTATDLTKLGLAAMDDPAIADIVGQTTAEIPVEGSIKNVNFLLGQDGIVGIKTGNTDKAGGCYLFAADQTIQGRKVTLVGAVLSQPQLADAIQAAPSLIRAGDAGFKLVTAIHKNQVLGFYKAPWGSESQFQAHQDLSLLTWGGAPTKITARMNDVGPTKNGVVVGEVTVSNLGQSASSDLVLSKDLPAPSPLWRLIR